MSTSTVSHADIARRAYQLWEASGCQEGDPELNWLQAERELLAQHDPSSAGSVEHARSVEPPIKGHHYEEHPKHSTDYHPGVTTDSLHHLRNR
jgi:hypothetical protein